MTLAGFSTAIEFIGISFVTMLPAPIIEFSSNLTPGITTEFTNENVVLNNSFSTTSFMFI